MSVDRPPQEEPATAGNSTPEFLSDEEPAAPAAPTLNGPLNPIAEVDGGALSGAGTSPTLVQTASGELPTRAASPALPPLTRVPSYGVPMPVPQTEAAGLRAVAEAPTDLHSSVSMAIPQFAAGTELRSPVLQQVPMTSQQSLQQQLLHSYTSAVDATGIQGPASTNGSMLIGSQETERGLQNEVGVSADEVDGLAWSREIGLHCNQVEESKLSFQLRFTEPAGKFSLVTVFLPAYVPVVYVTTA